MSEVRLAAELRTEFGKGAARRTRRAGKIPAVLYGHGTDPKHVALPALEFARVVREHGRNAVLTLDVGAGENQLALTKTVTTHPLKNYIEHVDLLVVRRGEKVVIDVPIVLTGEAANGTLITQDLTTLSVSAEALHIPEQFELSLQDVEAGTQILAGQVGLPAGIELQTDPEALVVNVVTAPTAEDMEGDTEAAEADAASADAVGDASQDADQDGDADKS
ncbi:MAG TPA: 50S ribosomal protein L25/general stress protein Ctc [Pseudonocardiaceae bacterium]